MESPSYFTKPTNFVMPQNNNNDNNPHPNMQLRPLAQTLLV